MEKKGNKEMSDQISLYGMDQMESGMNDSSDVVSSKSARKYDNESITALKGAERVRKRPSVIFGSDGIEGCQHSIFEILSNSIDEAREGYGKKIEVIRHRDCSVTVIDHASGIPVDYNAVEKKYNWELVFCECATCKLAV